MLGQNQKFILSFVLIAHDVIKTALKPDFLLFQERDNVHAWHNVFVVNLFGLDIVFNFHYRYNEQYLKIEE